MFVRRGKVSHRYIEFVKSSDGHALRSNREIRRGFQADFRDRFVRCKTSRFRSFVAIWPTSPAMKRRKRLAARVWLVNAKSVMC